MKERQRNKDRARFECTVDIEYNMSFLFLSSPFLNETKPQHVEHVHFLMSLQIDSAIIFFKFSSTPF